MKYKNNNAGPDTTLSSLITSAQLRTESQGQCKK